MDIILNGEKKASTCATLAELVAETGIDASSLIAEVNEAIIRQDDWEKIALQQGDQIELLRFVGGG